MIMATNYFKDYLNDPKIRQKTDYLFANFDSKKRLYKRIFLAKVISEDKFFYSFETGSKFDLRISRKDYQKMYPKRRLKLAVGNYSSFSVYQHESQDSQMLVKNSNLQERLAAVLHWHRLLKNSLFLLGRVNKRRKGGYSVLSTGVSLFLPRSKTRLRLPNHRLFKSELGGQIIKPILEDLKFIKKQKKGSKFRHSNRRKNNNKK
uniref:Ribosomal protein S1 n=1 Tax=Ancoracysta twista TaxID=2044563 RepID=A0A2H4R8H3_9EUKA|nr:ribosomal protein S1 [Ancoracysta twista]ATY40944.1 ribosomal protein S1 [Ancoracysta twista]